MKPPPARVLVVGAMRGHDVHALDARGYDVSVVDDAGEPQAAGLAVLAARFADTDFGGRYDLVCEHGAFNASDRGAYVSAAARALRPGGELFGAFTVDASALMHAFAPYFDVVRCQPGASADAELEVVLRRR